MRVRVPLTCTTTALTLVALAAGCGSGSTNPFDDARPDAGDASPGSDSAGEGDDGGFEFDGSFATDGADDASANDASLASDARPDVGASDACVAGDAGAPPLPQRCAPATNNECSAATDAWLSGQGVPAGLANGAQGNGFDDDCDGLVDEGCTCPGNGQTKDCFLLPATQASPATLKPVGWCESNSKGSLDCAGIEFPKWSGTCRGGQPPYADDVCAPGDFDCDGLPQNSRSQDCRCKTDNTVVCPTAPVTRAPYPNPAAIQAIDGSLWVDAAVRTQTTNWTWTVIGGDCDNVLPFPTYALYNQTNSTAAGARRGARTPVRFDGTLSPPRFVAAASEPLIAIQAAGYGSGVAGGQVYPAFGLSGDYIVQGEFDLQGKHYVCTQKVQVRAPGIRAELCWDTTGGAPLNAPSRPGTDVDLHFARLQGITCQGGTNGWENLCRQGNTYQDCFYHSISGCPNGGNPGWGYANSADSACKGWSSKRSGAAPCTNPRLDKDNVLCDATASDPTAPDPGPPNGGGFCGPENINLDNPNDGDRFVVGVNFYQSIGAPTAKPHVNLYCNGQRVLSVGYNPLTGQTSFPILRNAGRDTTGDEWNVATITSHVSAGQLTSCDVETIPSHFPDPTRDGPGGTQLCVDSRTNATPAPNQYSYVDHRFVDHATLQGVANGAIPTTAAQWCKH